MKLRNVTFADCNILLEWRNDSMTKQNSFVQDEISEQTHKLWFADSLLNERRTINILEQDNIPIGCIRTDILDTGEYLLSWSIAPTYRGCGYGTKLLELFLQDKHGKFIAKIKPENVASIKIAENNNFDKLDDITYVKEQK